MSPLIGTEWEELQGKPSSAVTRGWLKQLWVEQGSLEKESTVRVAEWFIVFHEANYSFLTVYEAFKASKRT